MPIQLPTCQPCCKRPCNLLPGSTTWDLSLWTVVCHFPENHWLVILLRSFHAVGGGLPHSCEDCLEVISGSPGLKHRPRTPSLVYIDTGPPECAVKGSLTVTSHCRCHPERSCSDPASAPHRGTARPADQDQRGHRSGAGHHRRPQDRPPSGQGRKMTCPPASLTPKLHPMTSKKKKSPQKNPTPHIWSSSTQTIDNVSQPNYERTAVKDPLSLFLFLNNREEAFVGLFVF